tara:strand:+ start:603 stop:1415 length:813 start_codon:yes stop_codon:yes gene_type:complete
MTKKEKTLSELLNEVGLDHQVKSLENQVPTEDIASELVIEQGLNSLKPKNANGTFLKRPCKTKALLDNKVLDISFKFKRVLGSEVGDNALGTDGKSNSDKQRFAVYVDEKFDTGIYFTQTASIKQFEWLVKYNTELFTDSEYSEYHIDENWKLPTKFQTDLGRNKCVAWTSNSGVPIIVPTISMAQLYDRTNKLGGTPFSRPNSIVKTDIAIANIKVGQVYQQDIQVLSPERWTIISKAMATGNYENTNITHEEVDFLKYYDSLATKAKA